ncbi:autotransporter outer membrane beta-barrel domain-containing protein [Bradyrhizobium sp. BWA-3-5]|uniref:autotransporter outer membrane beta-barrel domain-containing protein n=1 Tax=Bradyrhizobium sp. BWA-3-5 TaxID=3080013 RepID=UPI00293ECF8F|nr:autotransporter outer membrane beta-barrel domain-containing protein [Bradyrhizobium sp. BWA-3-5]WOH65142.1 autotransporter outer membrane beta-barrel domain-containing protein [Bradyrhizobium sp. BWA-3-5]
MNGLVTNDAATNYMVRKTGSLNLNGWSGGTYWTHYGPTGWYLDAVLQATAYQGTASTIFASLPTKGIGFVSSLEAGYPIPVPALGPGFVLEPQGQIVWQHV